MAKLKKAYFCKECGYESPKWMGRCPACGEWNTMAEEPTVAPSKASKAGGVVASQPPVRVDQVVRPEFERIDMGIAGLNKDDKRPDQVIYSNNYIDSYIVAIVHSELVKNRKKAAK
jgi:hypothetical protein